MMERIATHTASRVRLATDPAWMKRWRSASPRRRRVRGESRPDSHKFASDAQGAKAENRARTACHDAAQLCGDTRWRLVFQLAKEVPEDVGSEATGGGGETKKKSRRNVVGKFGCNDRVLFDAALGLAGFDKEFELKVRSTLSHLRDSFSFSFAFAIVWVRLPARLYSAPLPRGAVVSASFGFFKARDER